MFSDGRGGAAGGGGGGGGSDATEAQTRGNSSTVFLPHKSPQYSVNITYTYMYI